MTPQQKIKWLILNKAAEWNDKIRGESGRTPDEIDWLYDVLVDIDAHWDAEEEIRGSGINTNIPCQRSRNYESKSVAAKMPDGSWVGWTYWYGGGKHGEPEAIDWINEAYDVDCSETRQMVTVRAFKKL